MLNRHFKRRHEIPGTPAILGLSQAQGPATGLETHSCHTLDFPAILPKDTICLLLMDAYGTDTGFAK